MSEDKNNRMKLKEQNNNSTFSYTINEIYSRHPKSCFPSTDIISSFNNEGIAKHPKHLSQSVDIDSNLSHRNSGSTVGHYSVNLRHCQPDYMSEHVKVFNPPSNLRDKESSRDMGFPPQYYKNSTFVFVPSNTQLEAVDNFRPNVDFELRSIK